MLNPADASLGIVAYLALFSAVGVVFLFVNLLVGKFVRPDDPHEEKLEIYECGEPTIGSSFVQFDLRFYVIALLFIIFDVEAAFFFPWAVVFGKANQMADPNFAVVANGELTPAARDLYRELGVRDPQAPREVPASLQNVVRSNVVQNDADASKLVRAGARQLAWLTIVDIAVFFAILLVGFAYVWKRGDLDWVRAVSQERAAAPPRGSPQSSPAHDRPAALTV